MKFVGTFSRTFDVRGKRNFYRCMTNSLLRCRYLESPLKNSWVGLKGYWMCSRGGALA